MTKHAWEREEGESAQAYEAFECYRRLPPDERSLQRAWEDHRNRPGQACERAGRGTGGPHGHWTRWMSRWRWKERAVAWDEQLVALARDQELDRELKARLAAQEEELRQRQLMREEARAARAVGRRLLTRILQAVEAGQLEQMEVVDLLPHLHKISALLETGQKLDRLSQGEPTDLTRVETDAREVVGRLVTVMQQYVPEEKWEELARKLVSLEEDQ